MNPKLKRQLLKARAERSTKVRPGWQRWTTYYSKEAIEYVKKESVRRKMYVMDLIAEMIDGYRKSNKNGN
jgi:hypothetical protein